jgi:hypothetical protein
MVTAVDSINSAAFAAQLPTRITANALASSSGSIPESGPTSTVIRSTSRAPRPIAISATCPSSAWQTDSSCTAAGYRMDNFCYVRQRTDRTVRGVLRFLALSEDTH